MLSAAVALLAEVALEVDVLEEAFAEAELEEADWDALDAAVLEAEALDADVELADADVELVDEAELEELAEHEHPARTAAQTTSANATVITSTFFMFRSLSSNEL